MRSDSRVDDCISSFSCSNTGLQFFDLQAQTMSLSNMLDPGLYLHLLRLAQFLHIQHILYPNNMLPSMKMICS